MTDEQAERIASALETLVDQNEQIILRLNVIANASPQPQGIGMTQHWFGTARIIQTGPAGSS